MTTPGDRADRFLAAITKLAGGREPKINLLESTRPDVHLPRMTAFTFHDTPQPGLITGFTYGLSMARHPDWILGRPELAITVFSADEGWPFAIAYAAERLRGECPFEFGSTITIGEPITAETQMTSFLIFAPTFPMEKERCRIDVGDDLPIYLAGCYPIHESEKEFIGRRGFEAFWKLGWDAWDVERGPAVFD